MTAVLAGAREVIATRLAGKVEASYKDEKELVTTADQKSDAAILAVFQERLPAIDPEISFPSGRIGRHGQPRGENRGG